MTTSSDMQHVPSATMNVYFPGERRVGQQTIKAKSFFFSDNAGEINEHGQKSQPSAFGWMSEEDGEHDDELPGGSDSSFGMGSPEQSADYPRAQSAGASATSDRQPRRKATRIPGGRPIERSGLHDPNRRRPRLMTEQAAVARRSPAVPRPSSAPMMNVDPSSAGGFLDSSSTSSVAMSGKIAARTTTRPASTKSRPASTRSRPFSAATSLSMDRLTASSDDIGSVYNQREKVRESISRLKEHRMKQTSKQKGMREELEIFARQQRRQLSERIRVANECCSQLKLPTSYALPEDPRRRGVFDTESLRTAGMKVDVLQHHELVGSISDTHFFKELDTMQQRLAAQLGGLGAENTAAAAAAAAAEAAAANKSGRSGARSSGGENSKAKGDDGAGRWGPTEGEGELRKFIYDTVELASTLMDQVAILKKKAGPGRSFSPYV